MPGLSELERRLKGFAVTHFTDHDNVGRLTEDVLQCLSEGMGVTAHFALLYRAPPVGVIEFDRVFNRDHVVTFALIEVADHGRLRGGFPAARGTGGDDNPMGNHEPLFDDIRNAK